MADVHPPVIKHSVHTLVFRSLKRTHDMFISEEGKQIPEDDRAIRIKNACKVQDEHHMIALEDAKLSGRNLQSHHLESDENLSTPNEEGNLTSLHQHSSVTSDPVPTMNTDKKPHGNSQQQSLVLSQGTHQLVPRKAVMTIKPQWHAPWKLMRVISGHLGWVRCISVDPSNEWFATGSGDRTIKLWDLASGRLKLTLTGHISSVRGLCVSHRQPYLFSCGEDKMVKCWDLEQNKVVRHYHGHLSGVQAMSIHPTIDILVTGGRDATARVWDMRTKACVHSLTGHTNTVADLFAQAPDPQVVTASHDSTIRLWDLVAGKTKAVLTNHKKSVRALANHPSEFTFASASPENIKQWKFPDGNFLQNLSGHQAIVNTLSVNSDGVFVSGGDNGSLYFWDWKSGYCFQKLQTTVQPGSLDSEAGIFATSFDMSGCRLITAEADKTIKIYKEDENATQETHPVEWRQELLKRKRY